MSYTLGEAGSKLAYRYFNVRGRGRTALITLQLRFS